MSAWRESSVSVGNGYHTFLYLQPVTRIVIHSYRASDAVVLVTHVIRHHLIARASGNGVTATLRAGGGGILLMVRLDFVAGIAAAHRTSHRGQSAPLAAADLVAQQAA